MSENLPTPERQAKGDIKIERKWLSNTQYAVLSAAECPLILDALHQRHILSDRLYRAGETLRGIRQAIGCDAIIFGYIEKSAGLRDLAERQASFWSLYNDCMRAIPDGQRLEILSVCCDNVLRDLTKLKAGLESLDRYLARLYHWRDERLMLYIDYLTKGVN